ncbi:DUF1217 domain-containing protein [Pseudophaeobacter sp.]|jgi:hypothetical protein|uniref:DUF1217 domain-containing protein n=1 Tax=Pseudophaeobacter sp. TaxID=1971739 RepID=UPI0025E39AE4|nr:DUF1217 domain-containing protein [uncultured Pseudophaeobacter sp.]
MSFAPTIPSTGLTGWAFLQSTYDRQFEHFNKDPVLERDNEYFMENIKKVKTAEDLVSDYRLLEVALNAFGLASEINSKAMIQKVLEDGSEADDALANKLGDDRWIDFTNAFKFGPGLAPVTGLTYKMQEVADKNVVQSFEDAVGQQDVSMQIALYAERELVDLVTFDDEGEELSITGQWLNIIGQPQLQTMMQTALGLPSDLAQLDIDQQVGIMQDAAKKRFGSDDLTMFSDPEQLEKLVNTYLARTELNAYSGAASSGALALSLLQA